MPQVRPAALGEVHGQERDVVHHVDESQRRVELDAVERREPAVPANHVAAVQVAVAFPHPARVESPEHQLLSFPEFVGHHGLEAFERAGFRDALGQPAQLGEIVEGHPAHGVRVTVAAGGWRLRRALVQVGDVDTEAGHLGRRHGLRREQRAELVAGGELSHAHRVLERRSPAIHERGLGRSADDADAEVQVRRMALVEADFLLAERSAPRKRRVIEEAQAQRLLDLVGELAGE